MTNDLPHSLIIDAQKTGSSYVHDLPLYRPGICGAAQAACNTQRCSLGEVLIASAACAASLRDSGTAKLHPSLVGETNSREQAFTADRFCAVYARLAGVV